MTTFAKWKILIKQQTPLQYLEQGLLLYEYSSSEKDFLRFSCRDVALQRLSGQDMQQKDVALQRLYGEKHYLKNYSRWQSLLEVTAGERVRTLYHPLR